MSARLSNIWTLLTAFAISAALFMPRADQSGMDSTSADSVLAQTTPESSTRNPSSRKSTVQHEYLFEDRMSRRSLPRLTPELISQCLEVARELDSSLGERMSKLCEEDAAQFEVLLLTSGRRLLSMAQLRERDPQLYQAKVSELSLEIQIQSKATELKLALQNGSDTDAERLTSHLEQLLQTQLAMSIKSRVEYLNRMEEHIESVRREIDFEARHFQETVQAKIDALLENGPSNSTSIIPVAVDRIEKSEE